MSRKLIFLWQQSEIDEPYSAKDKIKKLQLHIFCYNQVEDNKVFVLKVHYNAFTQDADRV